MSADPVDQPVRRTDDDILERLTAIEHRLHQISTQLTTLGKVHSKLDKICVSLEALTAGLVGRL